MMVSKKNEKNKLMRPWMSYVGGRVREING